MASIGFDLQCGECDLVWENDLHFVWIIWLNGKYIGHIPIIWIRHRFSTVNIIFLLFLIWMHYTFHIMMNFSLYSIVSMCFGVWMSVWLVFFSFKMCLTQNCNTFFTHFYFLNKNIDRQQSKQTSLNNAMASNFKYRDVVIVDIISKHKHTHTLIIKKKNRK